MRSVNANQVFILRLQSSKLENVTVSPKNSIRSRLSYLTTVDKFANKAQKFGSSHPGSCIVIVREKRIRLEMTPNGELKSGSSLCFSRMDTYLTDQNNPSGIQWDAIVRVPMISYFISTLYLGDRRIESNLYANIPQ